MRLRHPRVTVRRLMVAVALVAVLLGGAVWLRRRAEFARSRSVYHRDQFFNVMSSPEAILDFEPYRKLADHHRVLEQQWERAARRPWLPFETEPAAPE